MLSFSHNVGPWEIACLLLFIPKILLYLLIYLLPSLVAYILAKANIRKIFIVNLLLGWTVVGWIVPLMWAISRKQPQVYNNTATIEWSKWEKTIAMAESNGITPETISTFIEKLSS